MTKICLFTNLGNDSICGSLVQSSFYFICCESFMLHSQYKESTWYFGNVHVWNCLCTLPKYHMGSLFWFSTLTVDFTSTTIFSICTCFCLVSGWHLSISPLNKIRTIPICRYKNDSFQNANFLISQPNPMVWPLIGIVSKRRFQWGSHHRVWLRNEKVKMKTVLCTLS